MLYMSSLLLVHSLLWYVLLYNMIMYIDNGERQLMKLAIVLITALLSSLAYAESAENLQEARSSAALLGKSLQTELVGAMQSGGPLAAISFCNTRAMPISQEISAQTGWQVERTSLLVRNSQNTADAWERQQLKQFEERLAAGEPVSQLEVLDVQQQGSQKTERYMKAIAIGEPCLACHGEQISAELSEQLYRLYPEDKARGYTLGQLRGAFTLQRTTSVAK